LPFPRLASTLIAAIASAAVIVTAAHAASKPKTGAYKAAKGQVQLGCSVTAYTTLRGRFVSATTAKGVIRQETIVAGSVCDTLELKFTAKRS